MLCCFNSCLTQTRVETTQHFLECNNTFLCSSYTVGNPSAPRPALLRSIPVLSWKMALISYLHCMKRERERERERETERLPIQAVRYTSCTRPQSLFNLIYLILLKYFIYFIFIYNIIKCFRSVPHAILFIYLFIVPVWKNQ